MRWYKVKEFFWGLGKVALTIIVIIFVLSACRYETNLEEEHRERLRQEGYEYGYEKGLEDGYKEGYEQGQADAEDEIVQSWLDGYDYCLDEYNLR